MSHIERLIDTLSYCATQECSNYMPKSYQDLAMDTRKKLISIGKSAVPSIISSLYYAAPSKFGFADSIFSIMDRLGIDHNQAGSIHADSQYKYHYRKHLLQTLIDIGGEPAIQHLAFEYKRSHDPLEKYNVITDGIIQLLIRDRSDNQQAFDNRSD